MNLQPLPGFRDFFPADLALRSHIFATWRRVATRYGFEEYDGPPLEPLELYTAKSGDEIVGQLYNFIDKGERQVSLRPEMTPTLARMVAARANGLRKPIRWFAIPQLFRYERQQRGRLREHFQFNCDLIGEAGPLGDAELIALALDVLRAFGFTSDDVRVRLSDRRVLAALLTGGGIPASALPVAYAAVDKIERTSRADLSFQLNAAGFTGAQIEHVFAVATLRGRADVMAALAALPGGDAAGASLAGVLDALDAMGLGAYAELDLTIVRGLAYYTGTVFELFDAGRSLRAICGGGRYDSLLQSLGGVDLPAAGFGMGDVVLAELLKDRGLVPAPAYSLDAWIAAVTPEDQVHVLALAHELRDAGFRTGYSFNASGLGKQLKDADARGARTAIIIGPDDRARGEVQLKDLGAKTQQSVPRDAVVGALASTAYPVPTHG